MSAALLEQRQAAELSAAESVVTYRYEWRVTICNPITGEEKLLEFGTNDDSYVAVNDKVRELRPSPIWAEIDSDFRDRECPDADLF